LAKRTADKKYKAFDAALSIRRQFLSCHANTKEIYYDLRTAEWPVAPEPSTVHNAVQLPPIETTPVTLNTTLPTLLSNSAVAAVPDVPISADTIVRTVIAQKLKKAAGDIPLSSTIKSLAGGSYCRD
jgi:fatty acid synthase subunit alpha, fungi type